MRNEQLENKYRINRYKRFDNGDLHIKNLWVHHLANLILVRMIRLQRLMNKQKLIIVSDSSEKTDKPIIFSPMHIGGIDVEIVFESIGKTSWLMLADCREMYRSISGAMLDLNGVIAFDAAYKKDRKIAKIRSIELLKRGENLIIFSEGAYNISPNRLVMYPYVGTAEMAISTGADIVPIGLVRDGKAYYVKIGKNISTQDYSIDRKFELTDKLRDDLATLCWEILEKLPITPRKSIPDDYYENVFLKEMFADNGDYSYTVDDVKSTLFVPKDVINIECNLLRK